MKQKLFLLIASISFFSCSQETLTEVTDDTLSVDEVSATTQSLLIDKDAVSLTSVDAKNVAALFRSKNGGVSSRSASDLASESSVTSTTYSDYPVTVYPPSTLADGNYGEYFYMNMGWGGYNNGWYRSNTYNASDSEYSYTTDQKIITVEK